jgi:hypothetical protein
MIDDWNPFQNEENKDDNDVPILLNNDDLESFGDFQEAAVSEQPAVGQLSLDDDARETATGTSAAGTIPIDRSVETIETTSSNNNEEGKEEFEFVVITKVIEALQRINPNATSIGPALDACSVVSRASKMVHASTFSIVPNTPKKNRR